MGKPEVGNHRGTESSEGRYARLRARLIGLLKRASNTFEEFSYVPDHRSASEPLDEWTGPESLDSPPERWSRVTVFGENLTIDDGSDPLAALRLPMDLLMTSGGAIRSGDVNREMTVNRPKNPSEETALLEKLKLLRAQSRIEKVRWEYDDGWED